LKKHNSLLGVDIILKNHIANYLRPTRYLFLNKQS
jgi:hypothetical protein